MVGLTAIAKLCAFFALSISVQADKVTVYVEEKTATIGGTAEVLIQTKTATIKEFAPKPTDRACKKRFGKGKHTRGKLWGCDRGLICNPPDRCLTEPAPDPSYECPDQKYCIAAPPMIDDYSSDGKKLLQFPYYPLDVEPYGFEFKDFYTTYVLLHRRGMYPRKIPAALLNPGRAMVKRQDGGNSTTTTAPPTSTTTSVDPTQTNTKEREECVVVCGKAAALAQNSGLSDEERCAEGSEFLAEAAFCKECSGRLNVPADGVIDVALEECEAFASTTQPPPVTTPTSTSTSTSTEIPPETTTDDPTETTSVETSSETPDQPSTEAPTTPTSTAPPAPVETSSDTSESSAPADTPTSDSPTLDIPTVTQPPSPTDTKVPIVTTRTRYVSNATTPYAEPTQTYLVPVNGASGLIAKLQNAAAGILFTVVLFSIM